MTLAICMKCGTEKFGALVLCRACGFTPETSLEKAKSFLLCEHHFSPDDLYLYGSKIKSGEQVRFDPIALVCFAEPFEQESYFWENFDQEGNLLPCRHCGSPFHPQLDEVLCTGCAEESEPAHSFCSKCVKVSESNDTYCGNCGTMLERKSELCTSLKMNLALAVSRLLLTESPWSTAIALRDTYTSLPRIEKAHADMELEVLATYICRLTIQHFGVSEQSMVRIVKGILEIFKKSWVLEGVPFRNAEDRKINYAKRFDQYDANLYEFMSDPSRDQDQWMLWLASQGVRNCFNRQDDLVLISEMAVLMAFFLKTLSEAFRRGITNSV